MRVAIIIDEERLEQEQSMLNRLCIGLMAEGVQVTRIVPDRALPDGVGQGEHRIALAPRIEAPMRVLPWMRRTRAARIIEQLEKTVPDVLYAVGRGAWRMGIDVASGIERPILLDVCSVAQARNAPRPRSAAAIAGYVACTGPVARLVGQRTSAELVSLVPLGVAVPASPREVLAPLDRPVGIVALGRAMDVRAYEAMLEAMSRIVRDDVYLHVFLELRGSHEHEIWRRAEKLDLLRCVSIMGEASAYRTLLTRCDLIIMPERLGEPRSIMLEAMAHGIPIAALEDPALDMLIENQTALIVRNSDANEWAQLLRSAISDPVTARQIGLQGRRLVAGHHRSSDQVNRLIETLERAASGGTYRLEPSKT